MKQSRSKKVTQKEDIVEAEQKVQEEIVAKEQVDTVAPEPETEVKETQDSPSKVAGEGSDISFVNNYWKNRGSF